MNRKKRNMTELNPYRAFPPGSSTCLNRAGTATRTFSCLKAGYMNFMPILARRTDAVRDVVRTEPAGVRFSDCRTFKRFVS